jgi:hypothetical protein
MEQSDCKGKALIDDFDNAAEVRSFRATPTQGFGVAHGLSWDRRTPTRPAASRPKDVGSRASALAGFARGVLRILRREAFSRGEAIPRLQHA